MTPYWILFIIPVIGSLSPITVSPRIRFGAFLLFGTLLLLFIGFRDEIGGDWENYLEKYNRIYEDGLRHALRERSLGYGLVTWLAVQLRLDIYGVNLICGAIYIVGVAKFCWHQPLPWLGLVVSFPYLIVVVAMGYSSQSVALAFVLLALLALEKKHLYWFSTYIVIAYFFHKSSIFVFSLIILYLLRDLYLGRWRSVSAGRLLLFLSGGLVAGCIVFYLIWDDLARLIEYYLLRDQWSSGGAIYRLAMNALPGGLLLIYYREFHAKFLTPLHWYLIAIASLLLLVASVFDSTAVDRLAIYVVPLQIYVWTRMALLFNRKEWVAMSMVSIIILYGAALGFWLNFANHADDWVPYTSIIFS